MLGLGPASTKTLRQILIKWKDLEQSPIQPAQIVRVCG